MALSFETYNQDVQQWGKDAELAIRAKGGDFNILHRPGSPSPGPSLPKIRARFKYKDGLISTISFNIPRHLIYVHKGAGKGRGGSKGSRWTDKYGAVHKTDPQSLGKMGTDGRKEKPFINQVLSNPQTGMDRLADVVAESTGDIISGNILIK